MYTRQIISWAGTGNPIHDICNFDSAVTLYSCPFCIYVVDGGWTDWTTWSECTVTCSGGEHSRSRECNNPVPQYGGNNCSGDSSEIEDCNTETCPPGNASKNKTNKTCILFIAGNYGFSQIIQATT